MSHVIVFIRTANEGRAVMEAVELEVHKVTVAVKVWVTKIVMTGMCGNSGRGKVGLAVERARRRNLSPMYQPPNKLMQRYG